MDLPSGLIAAMLLLGLATGLHCVGMCGGIVTAFSTRRVIAIRAADSARAWPRQLAFNVGRIATYAAAGALAGAAGGLGVQLGDAMHAQLVLYAAANILLILVGLHLAGVLAPLGRIEALGAPLWRRIGPVASRYLAARSLPGVIVAGTLWGWLPCGFVYGALATATLAGSASAGAAAMLAFGLGTLPWLMAAGLGAARLRSLFAQAHWRLAVGALVAGSGIYAIAHAANLPESLRATVLCL